MITAAHVLQKSNTENGRKVSTSYECRKRSRPKHSNNTSRFDATTHSVSFLNTKHPPPSSNIKHTIFHAPWNATHFHKERSIVIINQLDRCDKMAAESIFRCPSLYQKEPHLCRLLSNLKYAYLQTCIQRKVWKIPCARHNALFSKLSGIALVSSSGHCSTFNVDWSMIPLLPL